MLIATQDETIEHLTREEVAAIYKVSTKTITRWHKTNKIPRPVLIGGTLRWRRSDIERHNRRL